MCWLPSPPFEKPIHSYIQKFLEQRRGGGTERRRGCCEDLPRNRKKSGVELELWWEGGGSSETGEAERSEALTWKTSAGVHPRGFWPNPPAINCERRRQRSCCCCCWSSELAWCTSSVTSSAEEQRRHLLMFNCVSHLTVLRRKTFWEQTNVNDFLKQRGIMGVVVFIVK